MATRFYLPSSGTPPFTPTILTDWSNTAGFTACPAPVVKSNTALANGTAKLKGSATTPWDRLDRVYITDQLAAQSLTGSFEMVMRGLESNIAMDAYTQFIMRVVNGTGTVQRGLAVAKATGTLTTVNGSTPQELPTTTMATRLRWTQPMTTVAVQSGDRIQLEFGYRSISTSTLYSCTFRYGDPTATADHAVGSANVTTDLCPFVQTVMDLAFLGSGPAPGNHFHALAAA